MQIRDHQGRFVVGGSLSPEEREQRSASMMGKSSVWLTGRKQSEATKAKRSIALKGKTHPIPWLHQEKHWNWKGGISRKSDKILNRKQFVEWREQVFKRDDYTCQNPGCEHCHNKRGSSLHPHHIKAATQYPELAFDVDNGITYCEQYHLKGGLHKGLQGRMS